MGKFITFEGCDGVGKSTQIRFLEQYLRDNGYDVVLVREPGGSEISEKIRNIVLDKNNSAMTAKCECLLYYSSRIQLIEEIIRPALNSGKVVICDRFVDSSIAYQGYARNLGVDFVTEITRLICGDIMPNATIFIDLTPDMAFRKKGARPEDRIESEGLEFQRKVYDGFMLTAKIFPDRFIKVVPDNDKEITFAKILDALRLNGVIV